MKPHSERADEAHNGKTPAGGTARGSGIGGNRGAIDSAEDSGPVPPSQAGDGWRVEIGCLGKGKKERERVVVSLSKWRGAYRFDVRTYVRRKDGGTQATPKGINIAIADLPVLFDFLGAAVIRAHALGILDGEAA